MSRILKIAAVVGTLALGSARTVQAQHYYWYQCPCAPALMPPAQPAISMSAVTTNCQPAQVVATPGPQTAQTAKPGYQSYSAEAAVPATQSAGVTPGTYYGGNYGVPGPTPTRFWSTPYNYTYGYGGGYGSFSNATGSTNAN